MTLFPEASLDLASRSALPGSDEARRMTVTSGLKCLELYRNSGPLGSLVRMLLGSSIWRSTRCTLTWKTKVTPSKHLLFRLVPSTPRTEETDVPLFPTITVFDAGCGDLSGKEYSGTLHAMKLIQAAKMFPTVTAADYRRRGPNSRQQGLPEVVRMWPTPIAADWKNRGCTNYRKKREFQPQTSVGGQLNPDWVEWLMGFPPGWTEV